MSLKVFIAPSFDVDRTGGVARVVEAQRRYLPLYDIEIVDDESKADLGIYHAGEWTSRDDIPRVAHCHGLYWTDPGYEWPKWAHLRNADIAKAFLEADAVLTPSEWVANIIRRDMWAPTTVFPNGIDTELTEGMRVNNAAGPVFFNKARVDAVCEINSLTELARRSPSVPFVMVPPVLRPLPNVRSSGVVPYSSAIQTMRHAGIYLATTREVFGVSVLEAMACGVPILGYAWGGQREQLSGVNGSGVGIYDEGILVPPNDIDTLKEALDSMRDPIVWQRMSDAARERVKTSYLWSDIMERQAAFLRDLHSRWDGHKPAGSPVVSVVIPCYNLGRYLPAAVASVLDQKDPPPFEVIIVDDASTDGSNVTARNIVYHHSLDHVRVIERKVNGYLAETLNTGIEAARGKWIINLDADNMLPPDALHDLYRYAQRHPELDCLYGGMQLIKQDGTVDTRWGVNGVPTDWPPASYDYFKQMDHLNQVHSSAMFKRRMWERARGYRQYHFVEIPGLDLTVEGKVTRLNSDGEFWTRCGGLGFRFGKVTQEPTLIYRQVEGSMSRTVPEWDWTLTSPRWPVESLGAPLASGRVRTHEPIGLTIIIAETFIGGANPIVESLWPQTFDRWEVIVIRPKGTENLAPLLPYARVAFTAEQAIRMARCDLLLQLDANEVNGLEYNALERFMETHTRGVYDENDLAEEGVIMACGGCGAGMRRAPRLPRAPAPRSSPAATQRPQARDLVAAPRRTAPRSSPSARSSSIVNGVDAEGVLISGKMTLVEFVGSGFRTRWMDRRDPVTRQKFKYVFGSVDGHRRVLVYDEDLPAFTSNTQYRKVPREDMTPQELATMDRINALAAESAPSEQERVAVGAAAPAAAQGWSHE